LSCLRTASEAATWAKEAACDLGCSPQRLWRLRKDSRPGRRGRGGSQISFDSCADGLKSCPDTKQSVSVARKVVSPDRIEFSRRLSSHPDSKAREYLKHFSAFSREDLREQGALRIPPLRSPGFPVENSGVDQLHAALTSESPHTLLLIATRSRKSECASVGMTR
jgi:hypothetical protein